MPCLLSYSREDKIHRLYLVHSLDENVSEH
jgi:hypothetical protein